MCPSPSIAFNPFYSFNSNMPFEYIQWPCQSFFFFAFATSWILRLVLSCASAINEISDNVSDKERKNHRKRNPFCNCTTKYTHLRRRWNEQHSVYAQKRNCMVSLVSPLYIFNVFAIDNKFTLFLCIFPYASNIKVCTFFCGTLGKCHERCCCCWIFNDRLPFVHFLPAIITVHRLISRFAPSHAHHIRLVYQTLYIVWPFVYIYVCIRVFSAANRF